jgi:hypothetical protein
MRKENEREKRQERRRRRRKERAMQQLKYQSEICNNFFHILLLLNKSFKNRLKLILNFFSSLVLAEVRGSGSMK